MALKIATQSTGRDRRRYERADVSAAILVSPNGHPHHTTIFDLSVGGARIGLPEHFEHDVGALVRLYFPNTPGPMVLFAEVKRMAVDHVGVEFADGQQEQVNQLFGELLAAEED
jgi:hypothetical protein